MTDGSCVLQHAGEGGTGMSRMRIRKKILSVALALVFLLALLPGNVLAADVWDTVTLEDGTLCIIGYRATTADLVIPETIDGVTVTLIGEGAFHDNDFLVSVTIPGTVTWIGNNAFSQYSGLTSVSIPDSVKSIGHSAFYQCAALKSIRIPGSVEYIGYSAFYQCAALASVELSEGLVTLESGAFSQCTSLTSIRIPKSLTNAQGSSDAAGIFAGCTELREVTFAPGTTYISQELLRGCPGITKIVIPDTVTVIGDDAFRACPNLTSVTIPNSVTSIGNSAFCRCYGLKSIRIPGSVEYIGYSAFCQCTALASVELSEGLVTLEQGTFSGCTSLTRIELPGTLSGIRDYTFDGCVNLQSAVIPKSVTSIGSYAFAQCDALTDVYFTGTQGEWTDLVINEGIDPLTSATLHVSYIPPLTLSAVTPDRTSAGAGDTITWTAAASGGSGTLRYCFYVYRDGKAVQKGSYGAATTCSYTVTAGGSYTVKVFVKDSAGQTATKMSAAVAADVPINVTGITANKTTAGVGETITWTATASGGNGTVKYCFYVYKDGKVVQKGSYGTSAAMSFKVTAVGQYSAKVFVKDSTGQAGSRVSSVTTVTN